MAYYTSAPEPVSTEVPKSAISLDYIREKADAEYTPYVIDMGTGVLTLRNPIRLPRDRRLAVQKLLSEINEINDVLKELGEKEEAPEGIEDQLHNLFLAVIEASGDNPELSGQLCRELEQDFGMTQVLFFDWLGEDEVGEASDSPS